MGDVLGVTDLLADPARFNGVRVAVVGWFVFEREHKALYPSPNEAKTFPPRGVWVFQPEAVGGRRAAAALNRGWVRVVGEFGYSRRGGCGHFGCWPAMLGRLTELSRVDPSEQRHAEPAAAPDPAT
jgi:hypothetical protein